MLALRHEINTAGLSAVDEGEPRHRKTDYAYRALPCRCSTAAPLLQRCHGGDPRFVIVKKVVKHTFASHRIHRPKFSVPTTPTRSLAFEFESERSATSSKYTERNTIAHRELISRKSLEFKPKEEFNSHSRSPGICRQPASVLRRPP